MTLPVPRTTAPVGGLYWRQGLERQVIINERKLEPKMLRNSTCATNPGQRKTLRWIKQLRICRDAAERTDQEIEIRLATQGQTWQLCVACHPAESRAGPRPPAIRFRFGCSQDRCAIILRPPAVWRHDDTRSCRQTRSWPQRRSSPVRAGHPIIHRPNRTSAAHR